MFRPTDPQSSLLECQYLMPPSKRARLEKSWAEPFRTRVMPLIDEEVFRDAFSPDNGRPNKSSRLLTGLHLLKEWNDLTDEQVLDELEYNLQWQYALDVTPEDAHTCQKTLHNYRLLLLSDDRAREMFVRVTRGLAESDGIGLGKQRLDSTHILPNIAVLTRLGLFTETVANFLRELQRQFEERLVEVRDEQVKRYLNREGYFADAKREQARRRLPVVAADVLCLVRQFEGDEAIASLESFGLLQRLLAEQCEVVEPGERQDSGSDDDGDETTEPKVEVKEPAKASGSSPQPPPDPDATVDQKQEDDAGSEASSPNEPAAQLKEPAKVSTSSLQSPHDSDATYGRKGKGYEAQIAETCDEGNPYQLITGVSVNGANESDQRALVPMLDQLNESGMSPDEMLADTGYGSGANIVESARRGVDLQAPVQDPTEAARRKAADSGGLGAGFQAPINATGAESSSEPAPLPACISANMDGPPTVLDIEPFGTATFEFNTTWDRVIRCPGGAEPTRQSMGAKGNSFTATFSASDCATCPLSAACPTRVLASGDRTLRRAPATAATESRQYEQRTSAFKERYKKRSGIESTNREVKGRHGAGDLRVRGRPRVDLAMLLKSLAVNTKRAVQYHTRRLIESARPRPTLQPA